MRDQQKVLLFTYGGIAALVAVVCVAAIIMISSLRPDSQTVQAEDSMSEASDMLEEAETAGAPAAVLYTVKVWKEGIGVFDAEGKLIRTFELAVSTFPATNQEALKRGIDVTSKEALDKLLQDLTS